MFNNLDAINAVKRVIETTDQIGNPIKSNGGWLIPVANFNHKKYSLYLVTREENVVGLKPKKLTRSKMKQFLGNKPITQIKSHFLPPWWQIIN